MIQLEITVPESWADVTLAQYERLDFTNTKSVISTLCDISQDTVSKLSEESIENLIVSLGFINRNPQMKYDTSVFGYSAYTDLDKMTIGDLEILEKLCLDFVPNASKIAAFVYRNQEGILPGEIERRSAVMKQMTVDQFYGMVFHAIMTAGLLADPSIMENFKING